MDNLKEKARSSVSGMGKALKGTLLPGKRKESIGSSGATAAPSTTKKPAPDYANEEKANSVISKIPHSPSLQSISNLQEGSRGKQAEPTGNPGVTAGDFTFPSHYSQYENGSSQELLESANKILPSHISKNSGTSFEGISLLPLTNVLLGQPEVPEADETWIWRDLSVELMNAYQFNRNQPQSARMSGTNAVKVSIFKLPGTLTGNAR